MKPLDERIRDAIDTPRPAWIERVGSRYQVITKGVLFPNTRNPVGKTWALRSGALTYIRQQYLTLLEGDCPLPAATQEQRDAYQNEGRERRAVVEQLATELDRPYTDVWRVVRDLEAQGLLRFEEARP
ncbi:transcriptional regulator [Caulobacter virus Magneto]|uniref:transcriptional regulator n=1 Tax=Caulobacter virus Magneto TaxID=1211642 RepID=UPI00028BA1B0|nr:transcriptional regulator [Caulobacter virus Magneto]AFU87446.1 hypothetical protein CcrMagneto_gp276 [Caulobacter virus Magneto]